MNFQRASPVVSTDADSAIFREGCGKRGTQVHQVHRGETVKTKRKGTRNEHRTMALLEAAGYSCTRAAGSLGLFDVVGIGSVDAVLVQVKTRDWPGSVEMEQLRSFPCLPNRLIHRWRDRVPIAGREGATTLTFNLTLWTLCATGRAVQPPPGTVRSTSEGTEVGAGRPAHTHHDKFLLANSSEWNCSSGGHERTAQKLFQSPPRQTTGIPTIDCPLDLSRNSAAPSDRKLESGHIRAMK